MTKQHKCHAIARWTGHAALQYARPTGEPTAC